MATLRDDLIETGSGPLAPHSPTASEVARALLDLTQGSGTTSSVVEQRLRELLEVASAGGGDDLRSFDRARKVSVSLPEGLTAAVQQRVGKGKFSRYVTEAVARQLELDLLSELAALLDEEHGPIPEELLAEAGAAWPDVE